MKKYEFEIEMTCSGCSGAVERVLNRLNVEKFQIFLEEKRVIVETDLPFEDVFQALLKTGKSCVVVNNK